MELKDKNAAASDDEDDLEKLRLAALQSLRRTAAPDETKNSNKKSPQNQHKRRNYQGRNPRNGPYYNNRQNNTNLISIPTVGDESVSEVKTRSNKFSDDTAPKLILPQDRYCNPKNLDEKPTEPSSKFDRYDNSDKSESETEYEDKSDSELESPGKLEKSDSLEALMQELENEIQGDSKPKEEKVKVKVKKRKTKGSTPKIQEKEVKDVSQKVEKVKDVPVIVENEVKDVPIIQKEEKIIEDEKKVENVEKDRDVTKIEPKKNLKFRCIERKRSPLNNKRFFKKYPDRNTHTPGFRRQPYPHPSVYPENSTFGQIPMQFNQIMPYNNLVVNPPIVPLTLPQNFIPPPFDRPPSPLKLNTDDVLTITRAPLSPRSAAFVLQNREIIERRKKSPRRSYSRSPSPPRYRRSKSPPPYRRSPSPRKFVKSKSRSPHAPNLDTTRKLSPIKDEIPPQRDRTPPLLDRRSPLKSLSPIRDRRSPLRNKSPPLRQRYSDRKSPIPRRTTSPKTNYRNSPKASVRERLGNKNRQNNEPNPETKTRKRSLSLSPEPKEEKIEEKVNDNVVDPILEARRKKFETNEIKNTEGIIRLKPKSEILEENENKEVSTEEIINEDDLLDLLTTTVDDIFSDEETDEENEGRFKSSLTNPQRNVSVLPFTQLMEDSTKNIKNEVLKGTNQRNTNRKRQRSRSPSRNYKERIKDTETKRSTIKDKLYAKNRVLFRNGSSRHKEKVPVTAPIENKKIEIKIRNPSKYETTSKYDVANEHETLERIDKSIRKIEVAEVTKKETEIVNNDSVEIIPDSTEDTDTQLNQKCEAGDLRAQLSRKRAERQNKLPVPEDVQSRLLQNALQGAVFKKPKKSRKEKDSAPKDGKLPIHLRLGFANSMDIFQDSNKVKRKRSKVKGQIEQV